MAEGRIFAFRFGEYLACLDAKTGTERWRKTKENATELFAALGSGVGEATQRVLVSKPLVEGVTTTVKLLVPPLDNVPTLATTWLPSWTQPGEADTNVTPVGNASVSVTLDAEPDPRLATVSV